MFDGYIAARMVKSRNGDIYEVLCKITKSSHNLAVFSCEAYKYDVLLKSFSSETSCTQTSKKAATVAKLIIKSLDVPSKKNWS